MKTLITGGAGFIGSHLADKLVSLGNEVIIIDNFSSGSMDNIRHLLKNPNVTVKKLDLKDHSKVLEEVRDIDIIFHFAANPEVRVSTTHPRIHFQENIVTTFNILEAMRINNIGKLVFASSSSVYGEPENIPVDESAPIKPASVYGASKAACENLIYTYTRLYNINAVILRYANVIGPRLRHGVIYDLLMKIKKDRSQLEVLGDGTQVRSYIYIEDAVEATLKTAENMKQEYEVYNIASEDWITVNDIIEQIKKQLNLNNLKIMYKPVLHGVGWPGDVKKIALDITKIKKIGYKPKYKSIKAVENTIKSIVKEENITA